MTTADLEKAAAARNLESGAVADPGNAPGGETLLAGPSELGDITVHERVVAKIAAQAASEVPDAGAPAAALLGRTVSKVGLGNQRAGTELERHPKVDADVDRSHAYLDVKLSVRWPSSVPAVTEQVRQRIYERVTTLAGTKVEEVAITVVALVTEVSTRRVT